MAPPYTSIVMGHCVLPPHALIGPSAELSPAAIQIKSVDTPVFMPITVYPTPGS